MESARRVTPVRRRSAAVVCPDEEHTDKFSQEPPPRPATVIKHRLMLVLSFAVNSVVLAAVLLTIYGAVWEYSTRRYLKGFSDAIIPASSSPEAKVTAILAWMANGPERRTETANEQPQNRDPVDTLNYQELLRVCGTATNAFVNLSASGGIESRRLLLLGPDLNTRHVVAEVRIGEGWTIVDPTFHSILRDNQGRLLTRAQLADPDVLRDATRAISGYDLNYNYERTAHIRLARIPVMGRFIQAVLNSVFPSWEESMNWTVLVERESYAVLVIGVMLLSLGLFSRRAVQWYAETHALTVPPGPWEQLKHLGLVLFSAGPAESEAEESNPA